MPRYKVLKSVAHALAHSFTSSMNYIDGDYVMSHLLKAVIESRMPRLEIGLLAGIAGPQQLIVSPVATAIRNYKNRFASLVTSHGTSMAVIRDASITISFDLERSRPVVHYSAFDEYPFNCTAEIVDDRGKVWQAEIDGWWSPDASTQVPLPNATSTSERRSLGQFIRSVWSRALRQLLGYSIGRS